MRGHVAGDDAREQVVAAARCGADHEPHLLAAIKACDVVLGAGRRGGANAECRDQGSQTDFHAFINVVGADIPTAQANGFPERA